MRTIRDILSELPSAIREPIYEAFQKLREEIMEFKEIRKAIKELVEAQKKTEKRVEELAKRVEELSEAQKKTEQRVEELAEAQKKTEQRVEKLAKRVEGLAEAQKKTEQRVQELAEAQKKLEQRVEELAEAQKRTEERVEKLAEAQKRTEQRVEELAEAQKRTEDEIRTLTEAIKSTRQELGGLSRTISYAFENEAARMLPKILKEKYNIEIKEKFIREEIGGKEINIFGKGKKDGKDVLIIGEAKLRISERREQEEVFDELAEKVNAVVSEYGEQNIVKVIVTHFARKKFIEEARKKDIIVVQSFEW